MIGAGSTTLPVPGLWLPWEFAIIALPVGIVLSLPRSTRKFGLGCILTTVSILILPFVKKVLLSLFPKWLGAVIFVVFIGFALYSIIRFVFGKGVVENIIASYISRGIDQIFKYLFRAFRLSGKILIKLLTSPFKSRVKK